MDYYGLLFLYYLKGLSGKSILRLFFNIEVGGTEQLLPENTSTPTTTPILADIQYPDGLRTDQYFTYRETPTTISNKARIKTIKGNTLVWNQQLLAPTTNGDTSASADGSFRANRCSFTYDSTTHIITITNLENTGTSGFVFGLTNGAPLVAGHKYLQMCDVQAPKTFNFVIGVAGSTDIKNSLSANTYHHVSTIKEFVSSSNEFLFNFNSGNSWDGSETVYIKNAMLFDLTQMGLDISSPSDFTSLFPLPYYAYNAGTLLSFNGTGIKTAGKNLISNYYTNTAINESGNRYSNNSALTTNEIFVFENRTLVASGTKQGNWFVHKFKNGDYAGYSSISNSVAFTLETGVTSIIVQYNNSNEGTVLPVEGMVEFGSTASEYEAYTTQTTSLPISTYFPTGMKSAGTVYDELSDKAITRIGTLNFDDFTWQYDSQHSMWVSTTGISGGTSTALLNANIPFNKIGIDGSDLGSRINGAYNIWLRNGSSSVEPSGEAYYELATPTETPITTEDANEALSLLMGKSVSSNNAKQMIDIITKGE